VSNYIQQGDCEDRLSAAFKSLYKLPADKDKLADDVDYAEGVVDGYVGKRYVVPVTDETALRVIVGLTLDVFERRAYGRAAGSKIPEKVTEAAQAAMKTLHDIATGVVTVGGATAIAEREDGGNEAIIVDGNDPEFNRDNMGGF